MAGLTARRWGPFALSLLSIFLVQSGACVACKPSLAQRSLRHQTAPRRAAQPELTYACAARRLSTGRWPTGGGALGVAGRYFFGAGACSTAPRIETRRAAPRRAAQP
eukprot:scaffold20490_cov108-Isochrysis_galbana.AAC.1